MSDDITVPREKLREMLADIYCSGFGHEHLGRPECKGAQAADRAIEALTAPPPPPTLREIEPHDYVGRSDRVCDLCGLPDRHPRHAVYTVTNAGTP